MDQCWAPGLPLVCCNDGLTGRRPSLLHPQRGICRSYADSCDPDVPGSLCNIWWCLSTTGAIWVCLKMLCTPLYPMVLLIIIPMKNGYFIGNINPTFSDRPICFQSSNSEVEWIQYIHCTQCHELVPFFYLPVGIQVFKILRRSSSEELVISVHKCSHLSTIQQLIIIPYWNFIKNG